MFGDKNLKGEVKVLTGRLEALEQQDLSKKIERLKHELERGHRDTIEELRKSNHSLALKLNRLQTIAAVLFVMLSGIAVYYIDQYHKSLENRPEVHEVLIDVFQNRLGDTLDRISLLDPSDEDKAMVNEVDEMQDHLKTYIGDKNRKFTALSTLTRALKLIVNERNAPEASALLNKDMLPTNSNRFIASRALLLQAAARFQPSSFCRETEPILDLVNKAIQMDRGVVAAFNLRGICQSQESETLLKMPNQWEAGVKKIHAALLDNKLAYEFKPSQWAKTRFLNNKVWNSMNVISAVVPLSRENLDEVLLRIGESYGEYKSAEDFFFKSLKEIEECHSLSYGQPTYHETEAELHALECSYYRDQKYRDDSKAAAAHEKMINALKIAISKDLLKKKNLSDAGKAARYFQADGLLRPLFADPKDHRTIDPEIKDLIEERTLSKMD